MKIRKSIFFYLNIQSKDFLFIDNDDQLFKNKQFILNEKKIKYFLNNNEFFHPTPNNYECISNLIKSKEKSNKKKLKLKLKHLLDEKQINYISQLGYISSYYSNTKYFLEILPSIFHLGF